MSTEIQDPDPQLNALPPTASVAPETDRRPGGPTTNRFRVWGWSLAGAGVLAAIAMFCWRSLGSRANIDVAATGSSRALLVTACKVTREDINNELGVTAEFRPYAEVALHAKVSGYLQEINVDIGDRVKAGQVLARIEVPELQSELAHAVAAQTRAEADHREAHLAYTRLVEVGKLHTNLVAQQDVDAAEAKDGITKATIAATKADAEKYKSLVDYMQITAPFDGVITRRYADPGALIHNGDSASTPLLRLSQNDRLRLVFPVSVSFVSSIKLGDPVDFTVESLRKTFHGTVSRFTRKVETNTRTMDVEVDVPNQDLALIPGMYASVSLKLEQRGKALVLPVEAVSRQKNSTVYLINKQNEIEEREVKVGLETAGKLEILEGLAENDLAMIGSRSQVKPGQKVEVKLVQ